VQEALRAAGLDGWLLYEFHGKNDVAWNLLGLEWTTRRSFVLIPADGTPTALIHAIEPSSWRHWPWTTMSYSGWREMEARLSDLVAGRTRLAMEISDRSSVPTLDLVPSGVVDLVRDAGVEPVSSGDLVSSFYSVWPEGALQRHREASEVVKEVAAEAFQVAARAVRDGSPTTEGALSQWIRDRLAERGLGVENDCIVAIGPRAADPHYNPGSIGETINRGDVLLIDLWGKRAEDDCPADQTWMGYLGPRLPDEVQKIWTIVRDARDAALAFLAARAGEGRPIRAFEVDDVTRGHIAEHGYGDYFLHRTGHSIDRELHGSGPNLDNLETRDDRLLVPLLVPGIGFSVEPGIYLADHLGVRTEVNVYWGTDGPEVTVSGAQEDVFLLLDD
jgi:Xaa-Pro aminopeptidase